MPFAKCLLALWQAVHSLASLEHLHIGGPVASYAMTFDKKLFDLGYQYASLSKLLNANSVLVGRSYIMSCFESPIRSQPRNKSAPY